MRDVPANSAWVASIARAAERDEQRRTNPMTTATSTATGMTNKQFALARFWRALDEYKLALQSGNGHAIVVTSLRIHAAKGDVPKRLHSLVGKAFRESYRNEQQPAS